MLLSAFLSWSCLFIIQDSAQSPKNPELRKELLQMMKEDQEARMKILELMKQRSLENHDDVRKALDSDALKAVNEVDARNLKRLHEMTARYGWPGKTLVGADGAHAAWLLLQHCDRDRPFQEKCLAMLKAAPEGEVQKRHIAYLTDRVLVGQKKKQLYGTQLDGKGQPQPIEDAENVDARRKEMGMEPLAEYLKRAREMYGSKEKK